jgi:hypothetical protein
MAELPSNRASELLELGRRKFGELTQAEIRLFESVANGSFTDYSSGIEEENDPANAHAWGEERSIQADRVLWLCMDREASQFVTQKGIEILGVRIDGELDLDFGILSFPLVFLKCAVLDGIYLINAEVSALYLSGSHTGPIIADGSIVKSSVFLRDGFEARGETRFVGARIGGNLECSSALISNPAGYSLNAYGLEVDGSVLLCDGFRSEGEVYLSDATIGKQLDCDNGCFRNANGRALSANNVTIGGSAFLSDGFSSEGEVSLYGASIRGNLECDRGQFMNPDGVAIDGENLDVSGYVFLRNGFHAEGEVRLFGASIGRDLQCDSGQFINRDGDAINGANLNITASVLLCDGFHAEGEVRLYGASIRGNLVCASGEFINPDGDAINGTSLNIIAFVLLSNGFHAEGEVNLYRASIGGSLVCDTGEFINPDGKAIDGENLDVSGDVLLRDGFHAEGEVRLYGASIRGNLVCASGEFINRDGIAIDGENLDVTGDVSLCDDFHADGRLCFYGSTIHGFLTYTEVISPEKAILDLRSASLGTLRDNADSWPSHGNLFLHGLVYDNIHYSSPRTASTRIQWLHLQPEKPFDPQPYEQLALTLFNMGSEEDAEEVLIVKNKDKADLTTLSLPKWLWYRVLGPIIGFGYRPLQLNSILILLAVLGLGWLVFCIAFRAGLMSPSHVNPYVGEPSTGSTLVSNDYPKFSPFLYSLDMFLPLVNLHQGYYWLPNAHKKGDWLAPAIPVPRKLHRNGRLQIRVPLWGTLIRLYLCVHITLGWVLISLLFVGLTGLVRT